MMKSFKSKHLIQTKANGGVNPESKAGNMYVENESQVDDCGNNSPIKSIIRVQRAMGLNESAVVVGSLQS
jgi:hypothetical protein